MLQLIEIINNAVNNFIWGVPAMICIFGVGLYLSLRTRFLQIRKFPYAIRTTLGRMFRKRDASDGAITPFQAVCTALAATVGTGNIAGVAGAIAIGGPGAVFWMWVSALLGMCTKFAEVTLAVFYHEKNANGELVGGPMYYIKTVSAKMAFSGLSFRCFRCTDCVRNRKCNAGQHHHNRSQLRTDELPCDLKGRDPDLQPVSGYHHCGTRSADPARRCQTDRTGNRKARSVYGSVLYCPCHRCNFAESQPDSVCFRIDP